MTGFTEDYARLNERQRQAVDTIEGPVLVIAGPGTGKTQLLSMRAANIVRIGAVSPSNILCLTYTDAGAAEMQARMTKIMGPSGGEVAVHTFHSFGRWIIAQYPEKFTKERALKQLDDLSRHRILELLLSRLPLRHPFAVRGENDRFIRQNAVQNAIDAFKQAGLRPNDIRKVMQANQKVFEYLQTLLDEIFGSTLSAKRLPDILARIEQDLQDLGDNSLAHVLLQSLLDAVHDSIAAGKTKDLGDWRTANTVKQDGLRILKSQASSTQLLDVVQLYENYQIYLDDQGYYDYSDMILWALNALEQDTDMRLDVAERFQYIMVDEYQDTNGAQARLLDALLQANPVDAPNVLMVGDDDQAIMRFQGAEVSGMLHFIDIYKPTVITLVDNYRSTQSILDASKQVGDQITERLEAKSLQAHNQNPGIIEHRSYSNVYTQYAAVATHVAGLLEQGVSPEQIAIIGRKHAQLVEFVPYLTAAGVHVRYDNREDILSEPEIDQLLKLAGVIDAITHHPGRVNGLLPEVLAAPYWQLPALALYKLGATAKINKTAWLDEMLEDEQFAPIAEWLITAAKVSHTSNFTRMLDVLVGREKLENSRLGSSPYANLINPSDPQKYATLLSRLIRLRRAVLEARPNAHGLADLLVVVAEYRSADIRLIDDSQLTHSESSGIQVMSAHGAKGREFEHVIVLSLLETVWGNKAKSNNNRIRLPENLPLYPAGDTENDKLRLLYVAMTRAKTHLLLTGYTHNIDGKPTIPLSFISFGDNQNGWWQPQLQTQNLESPIPLLETIWRPRQPDSGTMKDVLDPLLRNFRLSPSALRNFLDICYGGPISTIEKDILGFPSAYTPSSAMGSAVHHVLESAHQAYKNNEPMSDEEIIKIFDEKLENSGVAASELEAVRAHGHEFLPLFMQDFVATDFDDITNTEFYVNATLPNSGVQIVGKLDAAAIHENRIRIIDYKSGKPPLPDWKTSGLSPGKKVSVHFYRQQLLVYKILIENSPAFKGKHVDSAELVFVEPHAETGKFVRLQITDFDEAELARTQMLITAVHQRITNLDLPDTTVYSKDLKGVEQFEQDLLDEVRLQ